METILLGGIIHPISSEPLEEGYITIKNGRIIEIERGRPPQEMLKGSEVIDCSEKHILPGLMMPIPILESLRKKQVRLVRIIMKLQIPWYLTYVLWMA